MIGMMECWGLENWGNGVLGRIKTNYKLLIVNGICVLRTSFKRLRRKKDAHRLHRLTQIIKKTKKSV
jgi:hypothetical protein